jgi:hypothetical protein
LGRWISPHPNLEGSIRSQKNKSSAQIMTPDIRDILKKINIFQKSTEDPTEEQSPKTKNNKGIHHVK